MTGKNKLYLVKREVYAKNLKEALTKSGEVYSVEEALNQVPPEEDKKEIGFKKDVNKQCKKQR